ncbi:MAG: phosphoribosylformylglycinamidine synthase subunit PurQ [Candidatus Gastranaerophilales bacterium]|nr:phosphoribosylformylglycinamidine synthase subunit PurQ [Candidatus Gastranaerophilales bacterium]
MKSAVVVFPGTNCDRDTYEACRFFGWKCDYIRHDETNLQGYNVIFLPGGFSYGDYIRSGRLAKFSPVVAALKDYIKNKCGMTIGICNGFQILCESKLIDGVLTDNINNKFICSEENLIYQNTELTLPIAHKEGRYIAPDNFDKNLIFLKYKNNPNGSDMNIAGLYDKKNKILAMMPHPERAVFKETGNTDGRVIFEFIHKEALC